jgi:hypothetical protein
VEEIRDFSIGGERESSYKSNIKAKTGPVLNYTPHGLPLLMVRVPWICLPISAHDNIMAVSGEILKFEF